MSPPDLAMDQIHTLERSQYLPSEQGRKVKSGGHPRQTTGKAQSQHFMIYGSHSGGMCYTELTIAFLSSLSQTWSHGQDQNNGNNNGHDKIEGARWCRVSPIDKELQAINQEQF